MTTRGQDENHMGGRDKEPIVELMSVPHAFEAETLVAELRANDIQAMVDHGDGGGFLPHLAVGRGHRILVFESDVDRARELVARIELPEE